MKFFATVLVDLLNFEWNISETISQIKLKFDENKF